MSLTDYIRRSAEALLATADNDTEVRCAKAVSYIVAALSGGRPLLICGNGGSACDAMHITGELVGRFLKERQPYNVVCLSSNPAVLTAWSNDYNFDSVFARQVRAYGSRGAVLIGLSTSGNSANIVNAFRTARELEMTSIGLTGRGGGELASVSDVLIEADSTETPVIQQCHICLYHYLCQQVELRMCATTT